MFSLHTCTNKDIDENMNIHVALEMFTVFQEDSWETLCLGCSLILLFCQKIILKGVQEQELSGWGRECGNNTELFV